MAARTRSHTRWAALGATAALLLGAGGVLTSSASSGVASSFVPITPCRLLDTRPAPENIGPRATPVGAGETYAALVRGSNGNCTIPSTATAVSMNVTIIEPTAPSFLTVWPADATRPLTANLNWVAGQAPTPNAVTAQLSADGHLAFFNLAGTVHLAADIVGYYEPASAGPPGPIGPTGPPGVNGVDGMDGMDAVEPAHIVWVATSGGDFTSLSAALASITDASAANPYLIQVAPGTYVEPSAIILKNHVDIQGSGEDATILTCACSAAGEADGSSAVLRAAGPNLTAEVRHLTIRNTGGPGASSVAIWTSNVSAGAVSFLHVIAQAGGSAVAIGVVNQSSAPMFTSVTMQADGSTHGYGMMNFESSAPTIASSSFTATGFAQASGLENNTSSPTISGSTFIGNSTSDARGISNLAGGNPTITDSIIAATASAVAQGVYSSTNSAPTITGSVITATSTNFAYGAYNDGSSDVIIRSTTIRANAVTEGVAVLNETASSSAISSSTLTGSTDSVRHLGLGNMSWISSSVLDKNPTGSATPKGFKCDGTYLAGTLTPVTCPA